MAKTHAQLILIVGVKRVMVVILYIYVLPKVRIYISYIGQIKIASVARVPHQLGGGYGTVALSIPAAFRRAGVKLPDPGSRRLRLTKSSSMDDEVSWVVCVVQAVNPTTVDSFT